MHFLLFCREEWVAVVVQDGVQKVLSSFAEALRRESMRVNEGSVGGNRGVRAIFFFFLLLFVCSTENRD